MAEVKRENYYLMLGLSLDPPVRDVATIEKTIKSKEAEWNRKVGHPTQGLLFKKYASMVPDMRDVLLGGALDQEINGALEHVKRELAELLDTIAASGECTETQVKALCAKVPQFSEKKIRGMIKVPIVAKSTPKFTPPKKPAEPRVKPTDDATMNKFARLLEVLNIENIYDFLGCSRTVSFETMRQEASKVSAGVSKAMTKTAEVSAKGELAGLVLNYFKSAEAKVAYDLALKSYTAQKKLVEDRFPLRCVDKTVSLANYQASIADCRAIGMAQDEAEYFVYHFYCEQRKCPPPTMPEQAKDLPKVIYCPGCLTSNPEGSESCSNCGMPFKAKCPRCGHMVDLDKPYCSHGGCGFPIGDMPIALSRIKDGNLKFARGDVGGAKIAVAEALVYWPDNADGLKLQRKVLEREAEIKRAADKKAEDDRREAERKAREALAERVKQHLNNIAFVGSLTATVGRMGTVGLKWAAATLANATLGTERAKISYLVVRKEGGTPSSPTDGERLTETLNLQHEDTNATPGVIYGYGVFPCYEGVPKKGGISSAKIVTTCDVTGLKATPDSGLIRLQWKNPPNASGVVCVRKQGGIPTSLKDGVPVPVKAGDSGVVDSGLANRTRYGYRVFAVFKGAAGESICSAGVTCEATPAERPPQVDNLAYEMDGSSCARLTWQPLTSGGGIVKIYVSSAPLPVAGTFVSETDGAFAACSEVRSCNQAEGKAELRPVPAGIVYLTPVTCKDGVAVVGKGVPLLPCVSNLKMMRRNGDLEISWDWPKGCSEVRLLLRTDSMPASPDDPLSRGVNVMQATYSRDKAYIVKHAGDGTYYSAVYVVAKVNGKPVYSAPQTCASMGNVGMGKISYAFRKKKKYCLFGKADVTLEITSSNGIMPALMLVKKFGAQPLSRNDGVTGLRIPAANAASGEQLLAASVAEPGAFLKLFLENKSDESRFAINHPPFSEMKI